MCSLDESGERKILESTTDLLNKYLRKEITEASYQRSFYLENVNEDKIKAKLEDGILNIKIEKVKQEVKNKKIRID